MEISSEDNLFIRFLKTRDEMILRDLFKLVDSWLFVTIYAITGNRDEADDIIQDTWIKVIENGDNFDPKRGKFTNYIYTIAKNTALENIRRKNKYKEIIADIEMGYEDIELQYEMKDLGEYLRKEISTLRPVGSRDTLILYYFGGFDLKEISLMLNTKEYNVLNWLKRGRKQLEKKIRNNGEFQNIFGTLKKVINIFL